MLIDFDGLTIIIGIVIYILICIFIHKKYKKEKIYYVFSTIMFCYFMCIAKPVSYTHLTLPTKA